MNKYRSESLQNLLKIIMVLSGNEFNGLTPKEISARSGVSPSMVTRHLSNLEEAAWARKNSVNDRWMLDARPVQLGLNYLDAKNRVERQFKETTTHYETKTA